MQKCGKLNMRISISKIEKVFIAENMLPGVTTTTFARLVRKADGISERTTKWQYLEAKEAARFQQELGPAAILWDHHDVALVTVILNTYRKRTYPPGTNKSKRKKDKSVLELSAFFVHEC